MTKKTGIELALAKFDNSPTKLATAIGVIRQRVEHWRKEGWVPAEKAPDVEMVSGVPCEQLNPSVNWSVLRKPAAVRAAVPRRAPSPKAETAST